MVSTLLLVATRRKQAAEKPDLIFATFAPPHLESYKRALPEFERKHGVKISLQLVTGRLMFDRSTVQIQSTVLPTLAPDPFVELNPADAAALGLQEGSKVAVQSAHGRLDLALRVSENTPEGSAFVPRGYNEAPVNRLQSDRDENVRVRVEKV